MQTKSETKEDIREKKFRYKKEHFPRTKKRDLKIMKNSMKIWWSY